MPMFTGREKSREVKSSPAPHRQKDDIEEQLLQWAQGLATLRRMINTASSIAESERLSNLLNEAEAT